MKLETLIANSGIFDKAWYLEKNPDVKRSKLDPIKHYVRFGRHEGRYPCKLFDPVWYQLYYRDVLESKMDPTEHYIKFGAKEGRAPHPLFDPYWYENEALPGLRNHGFLPLQHYVMHGQFEKVAARSIFGGHHATRFMGHEEHIFHTPLENGPTIAVVAHVYYGDLAEEICGYLKSLPYAFTALFTVTQESVADDIRKAIKFHELNCRFEIKLAQNRGRNFGPFLVEFRDEILEHDLFVHIHTKKSLRTGDNQSRWREHLYKGVLGSEAAVSAIIGKFKNDQKIGLIFPTTFIEFGPWFHSWLGSGHRGADLFSKLEISEFKFRGLIDVPMGSMFWGRTAAFKSLLSHAWKYDDFDPEPSHHDGTLAHGIEHGICGIASSHGFDYIEYDYNFGTFRRNWSEKLLHKYINTAQYAKNFVESADTLSFDFYDTLVCRLATTPDDIHNYIGWVLYSRAQITTETEFFRVRKEAEAYARTVTKKGDVDIHDIYDCFGHCSNWSADVIREAKGLELAIEERCLSPREDVVSMLRSAHSAGKRTILISDSYMPKDFFERCLENMGIKSQLDQLYISADCGYRKDRDDVWPVIANLEVKGKQFVHVGDNEESDIHLPTMRDIPCLHVLHTTVLADLKGISPPGDWQKSKTEWRDGIVLGPVIQKAASNAFLSNDSFRPVSLDTPEDVGYSIFGPLFFGFFTWIINHHSIHDVKQVGFLAREGHFLFENYEYIRKLVGSDADFFPPAKYFPMSRRLAMGAMQANVFDPSFIVRGAEFSGTVRDFLMARIGFEASGQLGFSDARFSTNIDREFILEVLEVLKDQIVEAGIKKKQQIERYCLSAGISAANLALVDLGYSGSIQSALQTIMPNPLKGFYMVTSPEIIDVFKRGGSAHGYFSEANKEFDSVVKNYSLILEAFLTAPHGQVIGFEDTIGQGTKPVFKKEGRSQADFKYLQALNDGAKMYLKNLIRTYGPEVLKTQYAPATCELPLRYLIEGKFKEPAEFWRKLHVDDDFCGNDELHVKSIYNLRQHIPEYS
ncbi:rhamnan synthesis F family protein [Pararhizobium sp. DWP3-4]|uniref:rhamnan synthesis F family protein n=1 Tax=Pararhizobium sp. DWP3-4 TaxID=2804565 RepID=UPI003CEAC0C3